MKIIEIPQQLRKSEFKFCLLKPRDKKPFEVEWQKRGYKFDNPRLIEHISAGGNYGVIGGYGNLRILDIDNREFAEEILNKLNTFAVRTGSGGMHFYFLSEYSENHVLTENRGEVRANNDQVVGPHSIHPNGNEYKIIKDIEIAEISEEILKNFIGKFLRKKINFCNSPLDSNKERDESRSGAEFRLIISLIRKGLSRENVFGEMELLGTEKWKEAHPAYREMTYKNAFDFVETQKEQRRLEKEERKKIILGEEIREPGIQEIRSLFLGDIFSRQRGEYEMAKLLMKENRILTFLDTDEIFVYREGIYRSNGEKILCGEIEIILGTLASNRINNEITGHIKRSTYIERKEINEPIEKICLLNGILNLNKMELEEFTPELYFFNKLPVKFDKNARIVYIEKFLNEIVSQRDFLRLQEFIGYCLYKGYPIQKAFMLIGEGSNGKSTFLSMLKEFLGNENCSTISLQTLENNRFAISQLHGKLVNIFADLPSAALSQTSMFKIMTGGDAAYAEKKFTHGYNFVNYAKLIYSANRVPKSPDETDAFMRRWVFIIFPNQFLDNADRSLLKKLVSQEELSGLLNFALEGQKRLFENGKFTGEEDIKAIREMYIRSSDPVKAFIMDCLEVKPDHFMIKSVLYNTYKEYCARKIYPILHENAFQREFKTCEDIKVADCRPSVNGERVTAWMGIKLIDDVKVVKDVNLFPLPKEMLENIYNNNSNRIIKYRKNPDILDNSDITPLKPLNGQETPGECKLCGLKSPSCVLNAEGMCELCAEDSKNKDYWGNLKENLEK